MPAITDKPTRPIERLRIVMLASDIPKPVGHGTSTRTYNMAAGLAAAGDLTLVVIEDCVAGDIPRELRDACNAVLVPGHGTPGKSVPNTRLRSWIDLLVTIALPWRRDWSELLAYTYAWGSGGAADGPLSRRILFRLVRAETRAASRYFTLLPKLAFYKRKAFARIEPEVRSVFANNSIDVVWFEHAANLPFVEQVLPAGRRPVLICNTHNIESVLARRADDVVAGDQLDMHAAILQRVEARAFAAAKVTLTCSQADADLAIQTYPGANVAIVPNGVDTSYFQPHRICELAERPTALFTGVLGYPPNADAVRHFLENILPIIRQSVPACRFVFAGREADKLAETLELNDPLVSVVSDPPDMRPQFEQAWVFVVPLRVGGGTRLKILEAMAMECAVVSTSIGAEGVPYQSGEHLQIADTPSAFARAVVDLLLDADKRRRQELAAAEFVRNNYDWTRIREMLPSLLSTVLPAP